MNDGGGDGDGCFDIKERADTTDLTNITIRLLLLLYLYYCW